MDDAVYRSGRIAAAMTALLTAFTFAVAFLTPPRSGPSCAGEACVGYPYTDIAAFYPRDYFWMVPATVLLFSLLGMTTCIHVVSAGGRRVLSLLGLVLAAAAAMVLSVDYFVQLTVVQPSVLRGEFEGLPLISQYNPHGIFIALEALGYLVLCGALTCLGLAAEGVRRTVRIARWVFGAAFPLALVALLALAAGYGHDVEYRFEIAVISITWTAIIAGCALLAAGWGRPAPR